MRYIDTFLSLFLPKKSSLFEYFPLISSKQKTFYAAVQKYTAPFFFIDTDIVLKRLRALQESLSACWPTYAIAYSFKTNYTLARLTQLRTQGVLAEVVSGKEYRLAKQLGWKGTDIVFNGPFKTTDELMQANADNALLNIDTFSQLRSIAAIAAKVKKPICIGLRIHGEEENIQPSRFGFSTVNQELMEALHIIRRSKNLRITGLHVHIGTDIDSHHRYTHAAGVMGNLIQKIETVTQQPLQYLDFGGGFPAHGKKPYGRDDWNPQPINKYIESITQELRKQHAYTNIPRLIVEPGRYLADDATIFITRVVDCSIREHRQKITVDSTITMLPLIYYRPQIVSLFTSTLAKKSGDMKPSIVYGASCREDDVMYTDPLPKARIGDLLIYHCVGAYNESMGTPFVFSTPITISK